MGSPHFVDCQLSHVSIISIGAIIIVLLREHMRMLFWWRHVFPFVEDIDKSGVSSLCGNSVEDILSNCQTVFHSRGSV